MTHRGPLEVYIESLGPEGSGQRSWNSNNTSEPMPRRKFVKGNSVRARVQIGANGDPNGFYGDITGEVVGTSFGGTHYAIRLDRPIPHYDFDFVVVNSQSITLIGPLERLAST